MLQAIKESFNANTMICVGVDIGLSTQEIITKSVAQWKKSNIDLNKRNTVFLIYK